MTFKDAYIQLLDYVNISPLKLLPQAKRAINESLLWCYRAHPFKMSEALVEVVYPKGAFTFDYSSVAQLKVQHLISVRVGEITAWQAPIPVFDYARLNAKHFSENRNTPTNYRLDAEYYPNPTASKQYTAFTVQNRFGLYPTPACDVKLTLCYIPQFVPLVSSTDTHFLLENAGDFVLSKALLSKFLVYVPKERIELLSKDLLMAEWESVLAWDKTIRTAENYFNSI